MLVRIATEADVPELSGLTEICFPPGDVEREPLEPHQVKDGVAAGEFLVAVDHDKIVGFLQHYAANSGNDVYVECVGVAPASRGAGIGTELLVTTTAQYGATPDDGPIVAMTVSPRNVAMIRSALRAGFVSGNYLVDCFGPGKDRLYFWSRFSESLRFSDSLYLPVAAQRELAERLSRDWVLDGLEMFPQGLTYRLRRRRASR